MAQGFRDLVVWQSAQKLAVAVFKISEKFPKHEQFGLTSQVRRSAMSVAANIAESSGRYKANDKIHLLIIARGSLLETQSHFLIAKELGFVSESVLKQIDNEYEVLVKQINAFINRIREDLKNK